MSTFFKGIRRAVAVGGVALVAAFGLSAGGASAVTVPMGLITNNTGLDASSQIVVDVSDGGSTAIFDISAIAGTLTSFTIAEIYWDADSVLAPPVVELGSSAGVNMIEGSANPGDLPAGNSITPMFDVTTGLLTDAAPGNANGIDIGEFYRVSLGYAAGADFNALLAALVDGSARIGIHVRSHNGDGSESYVSAAPVPLPAAGWLLIAGLGGLALVRRRKAAA